MAHHSFLSDKDTADLNSACSQCYKGNCSAVEYTVHVIVHREIDELTQRLAGDIAVYQQRAQHIDEDTAPLLKEASRWLSKIHRLWAEGVSCSHSSEMAEATISKIDAYLKRREQGF